MGSRHLAALLLVILACLTPVAATARGPETRPVSARPGSTSSSGPAASGATSGGSGGSTSREEARVRFERGVQLVGEEQYEAALIEFRRAFELTGEYRVLYNIAQVCNHVRDYACALQHFEA